MAVPGDIDEVINARVSRMLERWGGQAPYGMTEAQLRDYVRRVMDNPGRQRDRQGSILDEMLGQPFDPRNPVARRMPGVPPPSGPPSSDLARTEMAHRLNPHMPPPPDDFQWEYANSGRNLATAPVVRTAPLIQIPPATPPPPAPPPPVALNRPDATDAAAEAAARDRSPPNTVVANVQPPPPVVPPTPPPPVASPPPPPSPDAPGAPTWWGTLGRTLAGFARANSGFGGLANSNQSDRGDNSGGAAPLADPTGIGRQQLALATLLSQMAQRGYRDGGAVTAALRVAARETNTNPTAAQKEAGNYAKGRVRFAGLDIAIENPKGSERRGVDKGGTPWRCRLPAHYGYFQRTEGRDGDQVDCYIGDRPDNETVWVIDQVDTKTGRFDEHKVMLGFPTKPAALAAYEKAFSDGKGKDRVGAVTEMGVERFKGWLKDGNTKKPLGMRADGGVVGGAKPGSPNYDAAVHALGLSPQERGLYEHHLTNLYGAGGVNNQDGSRSTLLQSTMEGPDGRTYAVPTVWGGRIVTDRDELQAEIERAGGLRVFPSYGSDLEAQQRYQRIHDYIDRDTADWFRMRGRAGGGLVGGEEAMPLLSGKKNVSRNIGTLVDEGRPHDQAVAIALDVARRRRADGGEAAPAEAPVMASAPAIPAVVVRSTDRLGRRFHFEPDSGRRAANPKRNGGVALAGFYANGGAPPSRGTPQYDSGGAIVAGPVIGASGGRADDKPVDVEGGSYVIPADVVAACGEGNTLAGHRVLDRTFGVARPTRAAGGGVPIKISDGEHVLTREQVARVGNGNHDQGCRVLDNWVKEARAENIQRLKSLPGPAKG